MPHELQETNDACRRGDIKVIKSGTSWILDVGIICPG
jgi:hypothetical protein